jgi:hypothetical protein
MCRAALDQTSSRFVKALNSLRMRGDQIMIAPFASSLPPWESLYLGRLPGLLISKIVAAALGKF